MLFAADDTPYDIHVDAGDLFPGEACKSLDEQPLAFLGLDPSEKRKHNLLGFLRKLLGNVPPEEAPYAIVDDDKLSRVGGSRAISKHIPTHGARNANHPVRGPCNDPGCNFKDELRFFDDFVHMYATGNSQDPSQGTYGKALHGAHVDELDWRFCVQFLQPRSESDAVSQKSEDSRDRKKLASNCRKCRIDDDVNFRKKIS
jgi:hypothetical protein